MGLSNGQVALMLTGEIVVVLIAFVSSRIQNPVTSFLGIAVPYTIITIVLMWRYLLYINRGKQNGKADKY